LKVYVVDAHRPPGRPLERYTILGEVIDGYARCFSVRVELGQPEAREVVRYNVFGRDLIWVYRREDYDMISHWEHPMGEEEP
jgi:hypothetical protein